MQKIFKHPYITGSLSFLKDNNLNLEKLKIKVKKLDFHLDLAKDINIEFWQIECKRRPYSLCFISLQTTYNKSKILFLDGLYLFIQTTVANNTYDFKFLKLIKKKNPQ